MSLYSVYALVFMYCPTLLRANLDNKVATSKLGTYKATFLSISK